MLISCKVILLLFSLFYAGNEVDFLKRLQIPPQTNQVIDDGFVDEKGKAVKTAEEWEKHRETLRQHWRNFLGPMASVRKVGDAPVPPDYEILEEVRQDGFIRKKIRYRCEPGEQTLAFLLIPDDVTAPKPGVVVFHSTAKESYHQGAGLPEVTEKSFGYHLMRKGYVVLCPQNYIWPCSDEYQFAYQEEAQKFLARNPENKGMARMLNDALLAVDLLISLPEVDAAKIGCVGHSLGAKQALYLPAFDERVVCSVSSEGGIGIAQSNWEAEWYLGPQVKEPNFGLTHGELVAMIAPRPFLLIGGDVSDGDGSWPSLAAAISVYGIYGEPAKIGFYNHHKGHTVPPEAEQMIYQWFDMFLPMDGN